MSTDIIAKNCKPAVSYQSTSLSDPVKLRIGNKEEMQPITVPQLFDEVLRKYSDRPALVSQDSNKNWITQTFKDYWQNSRTIAMAFIKLGLEPRTSCGILAFNCPEVFITQMAAIYSGAVSSPIYITNSAEVVYHILQVSNATICVVDNSSQMAKVKSIRHRLPKLKSVIQIEGPFEVYIDVEDGYYSWSNMKKIGENDFQLEDELEMRLKSIVANECAILVFTSGTIGMPKGVMLSHDNVIVSYKLYIDAMTEIIPGEEIIVSYLPMSHVSGQADFFILLLTGACSYFADRNALKDSLMQTLLIAQPTRFFGVPRVFEKLRDRLLEKEKNISWMSKLILNIARYSVYNCHVNPMTGENKTSSSLGLWLGSIITRKYKALIGFERCKNFFIGAAPSAIELKKFFMSFNVILAEIYGLSETSGAACISVNTENLNSCGRAQPGLEIKISNADSEGHGEVCIRSRTIFMGYLNEPEKTKETFSEDGWMHTGDIGYMDEMQCLFISGRLKELIVTSGGENIPPIHIEQLVLEELPGLSNVMLIGDRRKFLTMLVTIKTNIDPQSGKPGDNLQHESIEWMKSLNLPYVKLSTLLEAGPCPKVLQSIQEGIDRVNAKAISNAQRVQKFSILPHDFSISTGELGPTLKLRRSTVLEKYSAIIENFYK